MNELKTVTVLDTDTQYNIWPPRDARGFLAFFADKIEEVPEAYRDSIVISIGTSTDYEDSYVNITITYKRPETEHERKVRVAKIAEQAAMILEKELKELERLKSKYE
jgi:hypothetical protein